MSRRSWNSLSIVPRIPTCEWMIGHSGRNVMECLCCMKIGVGGVPTMQVEDELVDGFVRVVIGDLVPDVVLLVIVERLSVG